MTNLDSILKNRHITLPTNVHLVKALVLLVVMYGCESWMHWDDPEGWDWEGGGKGAQDGEHMYTRGRFMPMYGKTTTML